MYSFPVPEIYIFFSTQQQLSMQFAKEGKAIHNQIKHNNGMVMRQTHKQVDLPELKSQLESEGDNIEKRPQNLTLIQKKDKIQIQQEYYQFFSAVRQQISKFQIEDLPHQTLERHRVKIITEKSDQIWRQLIKQGIPYVQLSSSRHNGLQCQYNVVIGKFFMTITILNLHTNSLNIKEEDDQILGRGSFGTVKVLKIGDKSLALKKIKFVKINNTRTQIAHIFNKDDYADWAQIRRAINQYCLYKICSMLKIGPQVNFDNCYDLVCYNDCIQFQIQCCKQIQKGICVKDYQRDIKRCLGILHSLKIIHKDIKRQNTLYSSTFQSYVLSDFGLTHSVKQQIWQKTETSFAGSITYSSEQMKRLLYDHEVGFVNLYLNDIYGLDMVLQQMRFEQIQYGQNFQKNSMSFVQNFYDSQDDAQIIEFNQSCYQCEAYEDCIPELNHPEQIIIFKQPKHLLKSSEQLKKLQNYPTDLVNYFAIRVIYRFLKTQSQWKNQDIQEKLKFIKEESKKETQKIKVIENKQRETDEKKYEQLRGQVEKFVSSMMQSEIREENSQNINLSNLIRVFGITNQEVHKLLNKYFEEKKSGNSNNFKLANYLFVANKQNKFVITKIRNQIMNVDRNLVLRNRKSAASTLKSLILSYFNNKDRLQPERLELLAIGLQTLSFDQLTTLEFLQLSSQLWLVLQGKKIEIGDIQAQSVVELCHKIYQQCRTLKHRELSMLSSLMKIHVLHETLTEAQKFRFQITQRRVRLEKQLETIQEKEGAKGREIKIQIIKCRLHQAQYLVLVKRYNQAAKENDKNYKLFTEYCIEDNGIKISAYEKVLFSLIKAEKLYEAQFLSQQLYQLISKVCFPKKNCSQFAYYYSSKGLIHSCRKKFNEALMEYQKVLECTKDDLRGPNDVILVKQTLHNMFICYQHLEQEDTALCYLEQCFQISINYVHFFNYQENVQMAIQIIFLMLKLNCIKQRLIFYIEKLASIRYQFVSNNRIEGINNMLRKAQFFPERRLNLQIQDTDTRLMLLSLLLRAVKPYLPSHQKWFFRTNLIICKHYLNSNQQIKCLPYLWNIFKYVPKKNHNQEIVKLIFLFFKLLQKYHASRRAFKMAKNYVESIPTELYQIRSSTYSFLKEFSHGFGLKDSNFYEFIWNNQLMFNLEKTNEAIKQIHQLKLGEPQQRIWRKRLERLRNCLITEVDTDEKAVKIEGENPQFVV